MYLLGGGRVNQNRYFLGRVLSFKSKIFNLFLVFRNVFVFCLKANGVALEKELQKLESCKDIKKVVNLLFEKCHSTIQDPNQLRITNGLIVSI